MVVEGLAEGVGRLHLWAVMGEAGGYHRLGVEEVAEGHLRRAKEALWVRSLVVKAVEQVLKSEGEVVVRAPQLEGEVAAQEHSLVVGAVVLERLLEAMVVERVLRLAEEEVALEHLLGAKVEGPVLSLASPLEVVMLEEVEVARLHRGPWEATVEPAALSLLVVEAEAQGHGSAERVGRFFGL